MFRSNGLLSLSVVVVGGVVKVCYLLVWDEKWVGVEGTWCLFVFFVGVFQSRKKKSNSPPSKPTNFNQPSKPTK